MRDDKKPNIVQTVSGRRLPFAAFDNEDSPLHQLLHVLQDVRDNCDDTVRVRLPDVRPKPSQSGLHRMKLVELMRDVDTKINSGEIDSARTLYHYFVGEFRHEMKPNLDLPPLSVHQPRIELPHQDVLVTIMNSAIIAEKYHNKGLNRGWDNLDEAIQREISESAPQSLANIEMIKLGSIRLNQLVNLITDCGAWQDGMSSRHRIWTQEEVDEAVSLVVKRDDRVNLLLRLEYFLKRCYPSLTMPYWERPSKVAMMTEEEILAELNGDCRNDYCLIEGGIRGIASLAKQRPATVDEFIEQCNRFWRPYGLKLREIVDTHVDQSEPADEKLQQLRVAVTTRYQHALKERDVEEIELLWKLVKLSSSADFTWEDVERKAVSE